MNPVLDTRASGILSLQPYQHAAWEPSLERMHANEMPWRASGDTSRAGLNRYPEPQPAELIAQLAAAVRRRARQCSSAAAATKASTCSSAPSAAPGRTACSICPPTFGMYKVSARIQGAGVVEVPLLKERASRWTHRPCSMRARPA